MEKIDKKLIKQELLEKRVVFNLPKSGWPRVRDEGLDYKEAMFCSTDTIYSKKYNLPEDIINNQVSEIIFSKENPSLKHTVSGVKRVV